MANPLASHPLKVSVVLICALSFAVRVHSLAPVILASPPLGRGNQEGPGFFAEPALSEVEGL
jgi:hypothetical protein